jgi:hypothetical protein
MTLVALLASRFPSPICQYYGRGAPKVFRSSAAKQLALFAEAKSVKQFRRPEIVLLSQDLGVPSLLKLLWLKIDIRSQNHQGHLIEESYRYYFAEGL